MLSLYSLRRGGGGGASGGGGGAAARAEAADTLSQILPALYVSGRAAALNVAALTERNIHYILNCSKTNLPVRTENFHYKQLPLDDDVNQNIVQYFGEAFAFIDYAISVAQSAVLVHCDVGVSRSCTIVLGFLMRVHRMSLPAAYELLERQRPVVCPNAGFLRQLVEYALEQCPEAHQTITLSTWLLHKFPRTDLFRVAQQLELQSSFAGFGAPLTTTTTSTSTSIATK